MIALSLIGEVIELRSFSVYSGHLPILDVSPTSWIMIKTAEGVSGVVLVKQVGFLSTVSTISAIPSISRHQGNSCSSYRKR